MTLRSLPSVPRRVLSAALLLSFAIVACGSSAAANPDAKDAGAAPASPRAARVEVPADADCATLSRTQCMAAHHCTLERAAPAAPPTGETIYTCRAAASSCEKAVAQWDLPGGGAPLSSRAEADQAIAACTSQAGCRYEPAECYCRCKGYGRTTVPDGAEAPACRCYCAGGRPPSCEAAK